MFHRLCLTFLALGLLFGSSSSAQADVTAVVNDGTLEITIGEPRDFYGEFYGQGEDLDGVDRIFLRGALTEDIQIFDSLTGTLVASHPRAGINAISIDARGDATVDFILLEFDGDIDVSFQQFGFCEIAYTTILGDVSIRATAARAIFDYSSAVIGGDLTFEGGPGPDHVGAFYDFRLFVGGDLRIDTGSGPDYVSGRDWIVEGDTFIDLGGSSGGVSATPADDDADHCGFEFASFSGALLINGEQGDDSIFFGFAVDVGGGLFVDAGSGADLLQIGGLRLAADSLIFLDGGTGNSDELSLYGLPLAPEEYTGFETVNP